MFQFLGFKLFSTWFQIIILEQWIGKMTILVTLSAPMMQHIQITQANCKLKKSHKPSSMQYGPTDLHLEDISSVGLPSIYMASQAYIKEKKQTIVYLWS